MWKLFDTTNEGREVLDGCVYCSVTRGNVDVENCLGCPRLLGVSKEASSMIVRCRVRTASSITELPAMSV